MNDFDEATYSAEDNKLRLYPKYRLDDDIFQKVKAAGFGWAPRQELFVKPSWSPAAEDLCLELVGEIVAEQSTLVERAEAKAERLDNLADKRLGESNAFARAADDISQRFAGGQPILVGHHSERKARKDQERMHNAMDKSVQAFKAVDYWQYKAQGVERFANRRADFGVRSRRIKKLLAELRDRQRDINHGHLCLKFWHKVEAKPDSEERNKLILHAVGGGIDSGQLAPWGTWSDLDSGDITHAEAMQKAIANAELCANSQHTIRWIAHLLNRLGYERSELGQVARFEGEITPVILQGFAREQGAHKPKAKNVDGVWLIESAAPLPVHISTGSSLELFPEEVPELMQECGYEVPIKKTGPKQAPLLNYRCKSFEREGRYSNDNEFLTQVEMTKEEHKRHYHDHKFTSTALDNSHRIRCAFISAGNGSFSGSWHTIFITDSKEHAAP